MSEPEGRMLREANPSPGEKAGFRPQHKLPESNYYEETEGKNGHLNVRSDDGEIEALGATTDAAVTNPTSAATLIAALKGLLALAASSLPAGDNNIGNVDVASSALPVGAATEATLAALLAKVIEAPATEGKQDALLAKDFATQTTLSAILEQLQGTGTGAAPVQVAESIDSLISAPATGQKTVTATAAELFAGASVRANRRRLMIKNEDPALRLRIGSSSVTQQSGFPVEPLAAVELQFDPGTPVAIYGISEGAALTVSVWEE